MDISRFMSHHVDILQSIKAMRSLSHTGIAEHAQEIAHAIMELKTKVSLHLSTENKVLYPQIHALQDAEISRLAHKFQDEMDDLAQAFNDFCRRWRQARVLAADPEGFRNDANTVIKALHQRIQHENTAFYPRLVKAG